MWTFPTIVLGEPAVELARYAAVMHLVVSFADENVNVVEAVHQTVSPPAYSRKNTGLPSRSLLELRVDVQNGQPTLRSGVAAFPFCAPLQKRRLEARGVEPLLICSAAVHSYSPGKINI